MKETEIINTSDFKRVRFGDYLEVKHATGLFKGIKVEKNLSGKLFVTERSFGQPYSRLLIYIKDMPKEYELVKIVRESTYAINEFYKPKLSETDFTSPFRYKLGTKASLYDALKSVDYIKDYIQDRMDRGDPIFDQWMGDAYDSSQDASAALKKLIEALSTEED